MEMIEEGYETLVPLDEYMAAGVHIGTHQKCECMQRFIYKIREDGVHIINVQQTDMRIRIAAKFLAKFDPQRILAVTNRQYAFVPVEMFSKAVGCIAIVGKFTSGTLTNPNLDEYVECDVLLASDSSLDSQQISEAVRIGIPVVALCDTNDMTRNVDLIIPTNNKGRKALALVYWLLAREICKIRGITFNYKPSDFESEA